MTALIKGENDLREHGVRVDRDIKMLKDTTSRLELQVDSLAEIVLQNRRGLDLLFLEQDGLCMALGETCCFCANNSGIIRESLQLVQQNLDARERQRAEANNCFRKCLVGHLG